MDVVSMIIALGLMFLAIFIPGGALSFVLIKGCSWLERGVFSSIFGTVPIYMVYFLVKNNIMGFGWEPIVVSYVIVFGSLLLDKDAREYAGKIIRRN